MSTRHRCWWGCGRVQMCKYYVAEEGRTWWNYYVPQNLSGANAVPYDETVVKDFNWLDYMYYFRVRPCCCMPARGALSEGTSRRAHTRPSLGDQRPLGGGKQKGAERSLA